MNRCNICLNWKCDRQTPCDCSDCDKIDDCPRWLRPTVRITTKCTQTCKHCCFRCSPECDDFMTEETAIKINIFLVNNNLTRYVNIMGGEFYCHPEWETIVDIIIQGFTSVRIVSNGDWAGSKTATERILTFLKAHINVLINISSDKYHSKTYVDKAVKILKENELPYILQEDEGIDWLVPVGRAIFEHTFYGSISCFCRGEEHSYKFLIDEKGEIYKCPYGIWNYDHIDNFLEGGFDARFKEFGMAFIKSFFGSCNDCIRVHTRMFSNKGMTLADFKKNKVRS